MLIEHLLCVRVCVCVCTCACCGVVVTITGDDNYKGKEAQEDHTFLIPGWGIRKDFLGEVTPRLRQASVF